MTGLAALLPDAALGAAGVALTRAWPDGNEVVLEFERRDGTIVGARWRPGERSFEMLDPGQDRRLPGLGRALADGAHVVGYRAGRRAVLRSADGFVKVLRPRRWVDAVHRHRSVAAALAARPGAPSVPKLVDADVERATMRFAIVPGEPLRVLLAAGPAEAAAIGRVAGSALAAWWTTRPPDDLPQHDTAAERAVLTRWHEHALRVGVVDGRDAERWAVLVERALHGLDGLGNPRAARLVHRDLHAGQVLVSADGSVALLDLDTASRGDPALDLGNLLAHLDLEVAAGHCGDTAAVAAFEAELTDVLSRDPDRLGVRPPTVAVYRLAALARLVGVHAFRPGAAILLPALLDAALCEAPEREPALERRRTG